MSENNSCKDCRAHSGLEARVESGEESVKKLWTRSDWFIGFGFTLMGGLLLNMVGIIILLMKAKDIAPTP